jgi:hypothetical protein
MMATSGARRDRKRTRSPSEPPSVAATPATRAWSHRRARTPLALCSRSMGASKPRWVLSDELSYPFSFEKKKRTLRTMRAARPTVHTLLARLAVPAPEKALASDAGVERQLLLYGTEVLLNIDYYYARSRREERKQWAMNAGIYGLALLFVGVALYLFFEDRDGAMASSTQIAAVVGAVLAGVKFLTESQDFQKTRSSFWQAGAELKMRLYTFLGEWCGRAWDEDAGGFRAEFVVALQDEIRASRDLQLEERRRFYDLMASPTRLVGATQQLSGDAQAALTSYVQARELKDEQQRQHELEQIGHERDRLYQTYPDDLTRPPPVIARLAELDLRQRVLTGQTSVTTVTASVATATPAVPVTTPATPADAPRTGSRPAGVPFDGRREP